MNYKIILSVLTAAALGVSAAFYFEKPLNEREKFSRYLKEHPFNNRPHIEISTDDENETDRQDLAWEQDFMRTMNPSLGRPTPEVLPAIIQQIRSTPPRATMGIPGSSSSPWVERGPNNVGGRTRAIAWDPNDVTQKKVWAGGATGGLWYNNDITSSASSWIAVNDFWANIAITCIAFDPNNSQIAYVGTGEGFGANSSRGAGIWKTTNGGSSWSQIISTTTFYYVNDIAVRNESGTSVVYAAVDQYYYKGVWHGTREGLQRSADGGSTWTQVLPTIPGQSIKYVAADIEISASNRIWIGTKSSPYTATDRGGGRILYSDNGTTWTTSNTTTVANGYGRVELACAPSNANDVYAMIEDNHKVSAMKKTTDAGSSWSAISLPVDADNGIPSADFSRGQAWYDMILAVDPNDANTVITGAIDLFISTGGGSNWDQISQWYDFGAGCSVVHADQHAIVYKPGSSSTVIFGNDGGVHYTSSVSTALFDNVILSRNKDYNVTQFYACAIHPAASSNIFLAGAQDNGTQRFITAGINATNPVYGGDGAYCFIDQTNPNYQIASYVYNTYYLSTNGGISNFSNSLIADQTTGRFINPAAYDNHLHILYSCKDAGSIWAIKNITGTPAAEQSVSIPGMGDYASHIRVSPYTTTSSTLFIGTESGKLFKVTTANTTPSVTDITGSSFPSGSISCVEIGAGENELLVTFFNYGVTSVWYTSNGGTSWVSKEGNLPDMPVRWALFNPLNRNEVILATELGIWSTTGLNLTSPAWSTSNNGMANVRVDMLQIRSSDNMVIAATYGRGLFSCSGFTSGPSTVAAFTTSKFLPCLNEVVTLTDTSSNAPSAWSWTITPSTFIFVSGTNANSQNPRVLFTSPGNYTITLLVSNAGGSNTITKNNYIFAGGLLLPFTENWENPATYRNWFVDNPDSSITWLVYGVSGNGSSTAAIGIDNYDYSAAQFSILRDGLISPPLNLAGYSSVSLSFKHAYRRYSDIEQDSFAVYVSTNCGASWTRVASYSEPYISPPYVFITNSNTISFFTPTTSSDWCGNTNYSTCKTINLSSYAGTSIKIKFENISGWANNLYLDDISITGISSLPVPVANFTSSSTTPCSGTPVSFTDQTTNSPNSWSWSFTPSTVTYLNGTNTNSQNPVVSFQNGGTYTVGLNAANTKGNNTITKTNYITVSQSVTPTITINCASSTICTGQNAAFTSTVTNGGTPNYQWKINGVITGTNASTFSSTSLNNNDTVTCTLTSSATCAVPAAVGSNSIKMTVSPNVTPTITINCAKTNLCAGQNALFTSAVTNGGTPNYQWKVNGINSGTNSSTFSTTLLNNNDIVTCSLTSTASCASPSTVSSNSIGMTINANPAVPVISQNVNLLTCNATNVTYQWYLNNSSISGATNQTYSILQSGIYKVVVTNTSGCATPSLDFNAFMPGIRQLSGMNNFKLFPNPAKDVVALQFDLNMIKNIIFSVYDVSGKKVYEETKEFQPGSNVHHLHFWFLPKGIYLVQMKDEYSVIQRSVLIE